MLKSAIHHETNELVNWLCLKFPAETSNHASVTCLPSGHAPLQGHVTCYKFQRYCRSVPKAENLISWVGVTTVDVRDEFDSREVYATNLQAS